MSSVTLPSIPVQYPGRFHWWYITGTLSLTSDLLTLSESGGKVKFQYPISSVVKVITNGTSKLVIITSDKKRHVLPVGIDAVSMVVLDGAGTTASASTSLESRKRADEFAQNVLEPWLAYFEAINVLVSVKSKRVPAWLGEVADFMRLFN